MHRLRRSTLAVILTATLPLASCGLLFSDPRQENLDGFVDALQRKDAVAAAAFTSAPEIAATDLQRTFDGIGTTQISARVPDIGDSVTTRHELQLQWRVPSGDTATSTGIVTFAPGDTVAWSPSILDSRATTGGYLGYSDTKKYTAPIVDRNDIRIMGWAPVTMVSLAPDSRASAAQVASLLNEIEPSITAETIRTGMAAAPGTDYTVVSLRQEDIEPIRGMLETVPGISLTEQGRLVTSDPRIHSPAFAGLPDYWNERLTAGAGWALQVINPSGTFELGGREPESLRNIGTTIDVALQAAAQNAVDAQDAPATIVAIEPTTGGVLAVAQNPAADAQGPISLTGLYPPGSTFKTVTTAAALDAGLATADTPLACPSRATIEGRSIPNDNEFDLGTVPLHTAFAQSCNTTQGALAVQLSPEAMRDTAARLGFGVDFHAPALTTVTGQVPVTTGGAARVEAAIGQGTVTASPFGIAVMEASLANNGQMVLPTLIQDEHTTSDQTPDPLPAETVAALRTMMRETVTSGSASSLADIEDLGGKTGTAETGNGPAHGWFAGIVHDIAFCAFIEGADSSGPAVAMSGQFLRGAGEALTR